MYKKNRLSTRKQNLNMHIKIQEKFVTLPSDIRIEHLLEKVDQNYVLDAGSIGIQYVFEKKIDHALLMTSLIELLKEYPALAGRADFKKMKVTSNPRGDCRFSETVFC